MVNAVDSDYQWGLGIEHELMILMDKSPLKTGAEIKRDLDLTSIIYKSPDTITQFLRDNRNYRTFTPVNYSTDIFLENLDSFFQHFPTWSSLPKYLFDLLRQYEKVSALSPQSNPKKVVISMVQSIHEEGSLFMVVPEFVSPLWENRTIDQNVSELVLKQKIVLELIGLTESQSLRYPSVGSIFPLNITTETDSPAKYVVDYTGSYHLNLSLPYPRDLIASENDHYVENHQDRISGIMDQLMQQTCLHIQPGNYIAIYRALSSFNWVSKLHTEIHKFYPKREISRQRWQRVARNFNEIQKRDGSLIESILATLSLIHI